MMGSPSELSLECKHAAQNNYSVLLKSLGDHQVAAPVQPTATAAVPPAGDQHPAQKLEEYLARLEEERLKIDAFKRELPLCMHLLNNAMETSRRQLESYKLANNQAADTCPVLEEFIPLKHSDNNSAGGGGGADQKQPAVGNQQSSDHNKANWMTSAQLWSCSSQAYNNNNNDHEYGRSKNQLKEITDIGLSLDHINKQQRNGGGGAFLPFTKEGNIGTSTGPAAASQSDQTIHPADLALASSDRQTDHDNKYCRSAENNDINQGIFPAAGSRSEIHDQVKVVGNRNNIDMTKISSSTRNADAIASINTTTTQTHRKQRRCWSPDLHRRFVNALQMLGGSQVATPKQIRELMKVDGLTNDEVKSHLQKYRLHTRRPSPSPQSAAAGSAAPQLYVLASSIWVPPEYAATAHGGAPTIYGPTSQVSPHYCTSPVPVPQEFHHSVLVPDHDQPHSQASILHHHPIIHQHGQQLHLYKSTTTTASQQVHSSPDHHSDCRGGGDRSESIDEDGNKSESSSWKGESGGENGGKRLATDEESNGSEITLKF